MVLFFTITGWMAISGMYILFTSGYHRRRKKKPWPTYELYFNGWVIWTMNHTVSYNTVYRFMLLWIFAACMIETFHLWRWNYGPYKSNPNHMGANPNPRYGHDVGKYNQQYYNGWDPKLYCRQRPAECNEYIRCVTYYNPYYPTHIAAAIFLWITFITFIGSTYHSYTLHVEYKNFVSGVESTTKSVMSKMGSKFSVGRLKKKQQSQKTQSSYAPKSNKSQGRKSGRTSTSGQSKATSGQTKATSGKTKSSLKKPASINTAIEV